MYENYSRQSLPDKDYRALLGSAICVFNSNNSFIIENILNHDEEGKYDWYRLIDGQSGWLVKHVNNTITHISGETIATLFDELVEMRNRIVHSFQITVESGEQMLATKVRNDGKQFRITEEYLLEFIRKNEELNSMLHDFRGY